MCYYNSAAKKAQELANRFQVSLSPEFIDRKPIYAASGFAAPAWPLVMPDNRLTYAKWGLVPAWVKSPSDAEEIRTHTINARFETVFEKPSFRESIKSQRCLVVSTGFYEWQTVGKKKEPWFIRLTDTEIFSMAGIFSIRGNDVTFSILTIPANSLMSRIHNSKQRMPLILSVQT